MNYTTHTAVLNGRCNSIVGLGGDGGTGGVGGWGGGAACVAAAATGMAGRWGEGRLDRDRGHRQQQACRGLDCVGHSLRHAYGAGSMFVARMARLAGGEEGLHAVPQQRQVQFGAGGEGHLSGMGDRGWGRGLRRGHGWGVPYTTRYANAHTAVHWPHLPLLSWLQVMVQQLQTTKSDALAAMKVWAAQDKWLGRGQHRSQRPGRTRAATAPAWP